MLRPSTKNKQTDSTSKDGSGKKDSSRISNLIDIVNIGSDKNKRRGWVESIILITCCLCVFSRVWLNMGGDVKKSRSSLARYPSLFECLLHVELLIAVLVATVLQFSRQSSSTLSLDLMKHSRQLISKNIDIGLPIALVALPLLYSSIQHSLPRFQLNINPEQHYSGFDAQLGSSTALERLLFASLISSTVLLMNVVKSRRLIYPSLITVLLFVIYSHFFGYKQIIYLFIYLFIHYIGTRWLLIKFSDSFTVGEASIVSQLFGAFFVESFWFCINQDNLIFYSVTASDDQIILMTLFVLMIGTFLIIMSTSPLTEIVRQPYHGQSMTSKSVIAFYAIFISIILFILMPLLTLLTGGANIFIWLFNYILIGDTTATTTQQAISGQINFMLIGYWIVLLTLTIVFFQPSKIDPSTPNIVIRKFFHLLALLMFVPGILFQPSMMTLSFGVALSALILIELLKYGRIPPLGDLLSEYMDAFTDSRDSGIITLTHIYLLAGCSLPCIVTFIFDNSNQYLHPLSALSGLLTIGVGDSIASLVGVNHGKTKWFGTSKSVEGTVAGIISTFISGLLILSVIDSGITTQYVIKLFIASFFSGILEASTSQIDNIVLPIIFFSLLNC